MDRDAERTGLEFVLPSFATERLILRPRTMGDLEPCIAMDRDPEVTRFVDGPWTHPVHHRRFAIDRIRRRYPAGMGYWSVFPKLDADCFVGWILLAPLDLAGTETEIGWRFVRAEWGRGYATEAALPVLRHAFQTVRLTEVVADIARGNVASARVAEKIGMAPPAGEDPGTCVRRFTATLPQTG